MKPRAQKLCTLVDTGTTSTTTTTTGTTATTTTTTTTGTTTNDTPSTTSISTISSVGKRGSGTLSAAAATGPDYVDETISDSVLTSVLRASVSGNKTKYILLCYTGYEGSKYWGYEGRKYWGYESSKYWGYESSKYWGYEGRKYWGYEVISVRQGTMISNDDFVPGYGHFTISSVRQLYNVTNPSAPLTML